ncbi:DUF397 domain-containing protein [Streptomyces sp. NPDC056061]|uniref:DUF397 domain-containing protein n=1 Tax=Streptomyces sp. NPDC056061 TaxID=3345700 RepID=UPI0035DB9029
MSGSPACLIAAGVVSARSLRASAASVITGMLCGPANGVFGHPATVHVRDSKNAHGPRLAVTSSAWADFVAFTTGSRSGTGPPLGVSASTPKIFTPDFRPDGTSASIVV